MANPQDEQKTLNSNIARARNLRDQIAALQRQYAENPDSNQGAPNSIEQLQRELNNIPNSQSWS